MARAPIGSSFRLTAGSETTEADVTRSENPQKDRSIASISFGAFAQQPGTPEPPGTPPQPPPDPMAPPLYEIPIPGPYQPPVIDDPQPRRSSPGSSDISNAGGVGVAPPGTAHYAKAPTNAATIPEKNGLRRPTRCRSRSPPNASPPRRPTATNRDGVKAQTHPAQAMFS